CRSKRGRRAFVPANAGCASPIFRARPCCSLMRTSGCDRGGGRKRHLSSLLPTSASPARRTCRLLPCDARGIQLFHRRTRICDETRFPVVFFLIASSSLIAA